MIKITSCSFENRYHKNYISLRSSFTIDYVVDNDYFSYELALIRV